jgi:hypothetical protein
MRLTNEQVGGSTGCDIGDFCNDGFSDGDCGESGELVLLRAVDREKRVCYSWTQCAI